MFLRSLLPALWLALPLMAQPRVFRVDDNHTVLGFKASTLLFDVPGRFTHYKADIQGDPAVPEGAKVQIDIDAKSINTAIQARDEHLRSADFFDVARFPKMYFESDSFRHLQGNEYSLTGKLIIKGVSRPIELNVIAGGMVTDTKGRELSLIHI